jgi:hypothetical protein
MTPSTYTLPWILPFVRQALSEIKATDYNKFVDSIWMRLEVAQMPDVRRRDPFRSAGTSGTYEWDGTPLDLRVATNEAFFYLIRHGYLTPMPPQGSPLNGPNLMLFGLSERGRDWADGKEPLPEDIAGYMTFLAGRVENMDAVIVQYVREALIAFDRQAYFAAAVMLGAASEKALYLLADVMVGALKTQKSKDALQRLLQGRSLNATFKFIQDTLDRNRKVGNIPYDGASPHLMSLFEAVRTQRNDAVHPTTGQVSADSVRLLTASFPYALSKNEDLCNWLSTNPHSLD